MNCTQCGVAIEGMSLASHIMERHNPATKARKLDYQPRMAELAKAGQLTDKTARDLDYQTPEYVLEPIRRYFGGSIPLDPASCGSNPTKALRFFTPTENGLAQDWNHPWFVNPPYGSEMKAWIEKIGHESDPFVCCGIALLPMNRTETEYWQRCIWGKANAVCMVRKRVAFIRPSTGQKATGNPYASAIWGFNIDPLRFQESFEGLGKVRILG